MNKITILTGTALAATGALSAHGANNIDQISTAVSTSIYTNSLQSGVGLDVCFTQENSKVRFYRMNSLDLSMSPEVMANNRRFSKLQKSFLSNLHGCSEYNMRSFRDIANVLCNIPFESVMASYNEYDESIDIKMSLPYNIHLSISRFVDDNDDCVVFSIHRDKRLLVSNEMNLKDLELRMVDLLKELEEKYA